MAHINGNYFAMPWLSQLVASLLPLVSNFKATSANMGSVMNSVSGMGFSQSAAFSPVTIIPQLLLSHLSSTDTVIVAVECC
jgi:hypothetical protein